MHRAYKEIKSSPPVEDPQDILTFLCYHFDLATTHNDETQDESIWDALRALSYASHPVTIKALGDFDSTKPSFVRGIRYVYQDKKLLEFRKAALFFLPLVSNRFFDTAQRIMEPDQMKSFCVDWASTIDGLELTPDVQKAALTVLLGMINSPHWRPHIVPEKWKLLEYFTSVPDDSQPLRKCINNPELIDVIKDVDYPDASTLWLKILWVKYKELIPQVQELLVATTKYVAGSRTRADLDKYLATVDSELRPAEEALSQYDTWSTDPKAVALKAKIESLQVARSTLVALRRY